MKFKILTKTDDGEEWWEDYDKDVPDARKWAEDTIAGFNETLRPHEKARELLDVQVIDSSNDKHHHWVKKTGGMSVKFRGSFVDMMYCDKCGITGKRYGLDGSVTIDSKYSKKAFIECHTAKKEICKISTND